MTTPLARPALPEPVTEPATRLRVVCYEPTPGDPSARDVPTRGHCPVPRPVKPPRPEDPVVRARAVHVMRMALEVLDGRRPVAHLTGHFEPAPLRYLRAAADPGSRRTGGPGRISTLRLYHPCPTAAEVTVVCRLGGRTRAVAARFEQLDEGPAGWRCTALRLG